MVDIKDNAELVDICAVSVDKDLPQKERSAQFNRQIKDPCNYKCGAFSIKAVYSKDGKSIEDCLRGMIA